MNFSRIVLLVVTLVPVPGAQGEDWPWFLGPRHDGTSEETAVNLSWPKEGPPVAWKQSIGTGYSAPSVLGETLVLHHRIDDEEIISCRLVSTGQEVWRHGYKSEFSDPYGYNNGPRCSPILADGKCFTLGAEGMLCCTNLVTGKVLWQHDLQKEFQLPDWFFGVGCSPVLDGERLYVLVGGQLNAGVVAFASGDGEVLWQAVGKDTWDGTTDAHTTRPYRWTGEEMVVSYASPIMADLHGQQHLLCLMRQGLVSLNPVTGEENFHYWFRPRVHESVNAARPVVIGNRILLSAAYRQGSVLLDVQSDGQGVQEVWQSDDNLLAHWSTPIHVDGYVYGFSGRHENEGELRCIRVEDGRLMWKSAGFGGDTRSLGRDPVTRKVIDLKTNEPVPFPYFGRGSLTRVGKRFIALGERGTLAVVHVNPQEFVEDCRTSFDEIHYPAWTAPVLSGAKMFLRSEDWLVCLDVSTSD